MTDPFDILRERLVAAAQRTSAPARASRPNRRMLVVLVAALLVSSSAAAAVMSLTAEDSAPLTGKVGGKPGTGPSDASDYVIELLPDLSAGTTGWCATLTLRHSNGQSITGGEGCGPAPPAAAPQIVGGALVATTPASDESVSYVVVDDRVASVRVDGGRLIIPRASAAIPSGWKAAVWFTAGGPAPAMPVLLDKAGQVISTAPNERAGTRAAGTRRLATRAVDPTDPPHHRCAIDVSTRAGLRAISERVVTATPAHEPDVNGRAFRTCASAVIYLGGRRFTAAVLVDARNPSRRAAPLPGQHPHPGAPGVVEAGGRITARRAGPGWLVVRGVDAPQRLRLLGELKTAGWPVR
jgi:hypothetical protein